MRADWVVVLLEVRSWRSEMVVWAGRVRGRGGDADRGRTRAWGMSRCWNGCVGVGVMSGLIDEAQTGSLLGSADLRGRW